MGGFGRHLGWAILLALLGILPAQASAAEAVPMPIETSRRVWIRVRTEQTTPASVPINIAITVFEAAHETLARFAIGRDGRQIPFKTGFHDWTTWEEIPAADQFAAGQATPWVEITDILHHKKPLAAAASPKTLVVAFHSPSLPMAPLGRGRDAGNLQAVTATIDWASRPDEQAIVKSIRYESENSLIALYIPQTGPYLSACAPRIRTLYDSAGDRIAALRLRGVRQAPVPKRLILSARVMNGYFYPLYDRKTALRELEATRLMGFNTIQWKVPQPGINDGSVPGIRRSFWEWGGPEWISASPWDPGFHAQAVAKLTSASEEWRKTTGFKTGDKVLIKLDDETKLLKVETVLKEKAGVQAFHQYLRQQGITPQQVGADSYDGINPIDREQVTDAKASLLFYYTVWFRQEAQAQWWKRFTEATREVFGPGAMICSETFHGGFEGVPDWFLWSRLGVMDVAADEYAMRLWNPTHNALFKLAMYRSAAKFGKTAPGVLWAPGRGVESGGSVAGPELEGITALMQGMRHLYWYNYGPYSFGWEGTNDDVVAADLPAVGARVLQLATRVEDYLLDGQSPLHEAQVAVLLTRGTDLWDGSVEIPTDWMLKHGPRQGVHIEREMLCAALTWNQIPFDIVPEEELPARLKDYRVLYVVDTHVAGEAQRRIQEWVRSGGVLFSTADAATRDEANQPMNLVESLAGRSAAIEPDRSRPLGAYTDVAGLDQVPVFGQATWLGHSGFAFEMAARKEKLEIPGAKMLARYEDKSAAAVVFDCERGKVVRIGTALGTAWARTAKPAMSRPICDDQRVFDPKLAEVYLYPLSLVSNLPRRLSVSRSGVAANFFEGTNGAVLLLADYESPSPKKVEIHASFKFDYGTCLTEAGQAVELARQGEITVLKDVPLETTQVLFLRRGSRRFHGSD